MNSEEQVACLITLLARMERLERIVGMIWDREDANPEIRTIETEHLLTSATGRAFMSLADRVGAIQNQILIDKHE